MQLFYKPENKQIHRALDTRNVAVNMTFRCTLKPYTFVLVNIRAKQAATT